MPTHPIFNDSCQRSWLNIGKTGRFRDIFSHRKVLCMKGLYRHGNELSSAVVKDQRRFEEKDSSLWLQLDDPPKCAFLLTW